MRYCPHTAPQPFSGGGRGAGQEPWGVGGWDQQPPAQGMLGGPGSGLQKVLLPSLLLLLFSLPIAHAPAPATSCRKPSLILWLG